MYGPTMDTIIQRLDRLEREARWWKILASVSVVFLGLVFLMGAVVGGRSADEVRARQFVLVDASGKVRAGLSVGSDGSAALALLDLKGKTRAGLTVLPSGLPRLRLYDEEEKALAGLGVWSDGAASLALATREGELILQGVGKETVPIIMPGSAGGSVPVFGAGGERFQKLVSTFTTRSASPEDYRAVAAEIIP